MIVDAKQNQTRLMNSLNALKGAIKGDKIVHVRRLSDRKVNVHSRALIDCIDVIEQTLWDLYGRIEELEKRLGDR